MSTNPNAFRLALFSNRDGSREFVVILSPGQSPDEYETNGITLDKITDLEGDFGTWPTDRELDK